MNKHTISQTQTNQSGNLVKAEIRRIDNDQIVTSFEHNESESKTMNYITKGYKKLNQMLGMHPIEARERFYIVKQ